MWLWLVVGLDFAFSMPSWFLREEGLGSAGELWQLAAREGERWLSSCEPPFWGRPGKRRPDLEREIWVARDLRRSARRLPAAR